MHKQNLIYSLQKRNIDLITISSHEGKMNIHEDKIDNLFPDPSEVRAIKFRANKPVILVTARVHPGETPSSYCMRGILNFLVDKKDARAMLLRKYFVIMVIPMLNPDGVYNGHYRMDTLN